EGPVRRRLALASPPAGARGCGRRRSSRIVIRERDIPSSGVRKAGRRGSRRMLNGKKIAGVVPAYNAAATLAKTYSEIPFDVVDEVILVDDQSKDDTAEISRRLQITTIVHPKNRGYGGNQKTCYANALHAGADIILMLHPDYQYTPR